MKEFWNERYSNQDYAYGTEPNIFFKESLKNYNPKGKLLLPAEGEGRNAVYAAKTGLEVYAFDISEEGKRKALELAKREQVTLHYEVGNFPELQLTHNKYDAIGLIFAHFPPEIKKPYYKKMMELLNPGGWVILEGFSKENLELKKANPQIGGPGLLELLFSLEEIKTDFSELEILKLEKVLVELQEGKHHVGMASTIRFIGRKPL